MEKENNITNIVITRIDNLWVGKIKFEFLNKVQVLRDKSMNRLFSRISDIKNKT